jgi:8-oxo-dGTP diphosphatase
MTSTHLTAAARAIIRHDRKLLLVTDGTGYWYAPGGRMNPTETLPECVVREVQEETGLSVAVGDVLAVSEYLDPNGEHKIECFFAATLTDPPAVFIPWQDTGGPVRSFGLFTDTDLAGMDVRPAFLRTTAVAQPAQPGRRAPVYVTANP